MSMRAEDGLEIRRDVDPDPDDLQGRRDGLPPGRRRAEAEAAAVDYGCGLTASLSRLHDGRRFAGRFVFHHSSCAGIAVRRTASLPLAYDPRIHRKRDS